MIHAERRLVRNRARDDVRGLLREMILSGELAADTRVEEVDIAGRIGVSRTPVREALIALEHEGLVRSRPHRGFVVTTPDVEMVRETYPILAALEAAALKLSWPHLRADAKRLRALNASLAGETRKSRQYELDRGFHVALTEGCDNPRLLTLLETERTRARRFDGAHRRGTADRDGSCEEHTRLIEAIERDDFEQARAVLAQHWERGTEVVITWLSEKALSDESSGGA